MGKDNKAQRTKNNARPASSGRSAELLGTNSVPPFTGFSSSKEGGGFSGTGNLDDVNPNVDQNFQILLKKMNKKDSTTKLKALQEFAESVRDSDLEVVKAVLPYWPRVYCQLALDADHRVRESLHQTQYAIVTKVKRNIAPYLKQLIGPWFTSQYDSYPLAASAAALAFQDAFPTNKLVDAIIFCQEEILDYIYQHLIVHSPQTLTNSNTATPEEIEAKYQRVLVSSLQGYGLYLKKIKPSSLEAAEEANKKIVTAKKFWKLHKHAAPLVRCAWYTSLIALCKYAPSLLATETSHAAASVLGNLDENDPVVLPVVWEAALFVITMIPDCWSHVSVDKLVLPKLWLLLKDGGRGNADAIYPSLLPFISKLPVSVTSDRKLVFYDRLFESMRSGFGSKMSVQSRSECSAIAECYVECIWYAIMKNQDDEEFCRHCVTDHIIPAIRQAMTVSKHNLIFNPLFYRIAVLITKWDRSATKLHASLLDLFWSQVCQLHDELMNPVTEGMAPAKVYDEWLLERQVGFCLTLRWPKMKRAENLKVSFVQDKPEEPGELEYQQRSSDFASQLAVFATKIAVSYFNLAKAQFKPIYMNHLRSLVAMFDTKKLFEALCSPLSNLYPQVLSVFLRDDKMSMESTVYLTFFLLKHLDEQERTAVFEDINELCMGPSVVTFLNVALRLCHDPNVAKFLKSEALAESLVTLTHIVCVSKSLLDTREVLRQCCTKSYGTNEFVISIEAVIKVAEIVSFELRRSLPRPPVISLAMALFMKLCRMDAWLPIAETLFLALFGSTLKEASEEVMKVVHSGIVRVVSNDRLKLLMESLALKIQQEISRNLKTDNIPCILRCVESTWLLMCSASEQCSALELATTVFQLQATLTDQLESSFTSICTAGILPIHHAFLCKDSPVVAENAEITVDLVDSLQLYLSHSIFNTRLLTNLVEKGHDVTPLNNFLRLFSALSLCESLAQNFSSTFYYHRISQHHAMLRTDLRALLCLIDGPPMEHIADDMVAIWRRFWSEIKSEDVHLYSTHREDVQIEMSKILSLLPAHGYDTGPHTFLDLSQRATTLFDIPTRSVETVFEILYEVLPTEDNPNLLYDCDVSLYPLEVVEKIVSVAQYMSRTLTQQRVEMWDRIFVSLAEWAMSVRKSLPHLLATSTNAAFPICGPTKWITAEIPVSNTPEDVGIVDALLSTSQDVDSSMLSDSNEEVAPSTANENDVLDDDSDPNQNNVVQLSDSVVWTEELAANHKTALFTINVCKLLYNMNEYLSSTGDNEESMDRYHGQLSEEWKDVFGQVVGDVLIETFLMIAEKAKSDGLSMLDVPVIQHLDSALQWVHFDVKKHTNLLDCCLQTMQSPILPLQALAYQILNNLVPYYVDLDFQIMTLLEDMNTKNLNIRYNLHHLFPPMNECHTEVAACLEGVRLGETVQVEPYTDNNTAILGYLWFWLIIMDKCEMADSPLRCQYANILRDGGYLAQVLGHIFRLMPDEVLDSTDARSKSAKHASLFSTSPGVAYNKTGSNNLVEHTACWLYWRLLCLLPAEVRVWWSSPELRCSGVVERVTIKFVSPQLCDYEIQQVQEKMASEVKKYDNMKIKVHPNVREVSAVYTVDEARMELVMALPCNYPLGLVKIETPRNVVGNNQSRTWLMQLTMFLHCQNGSLWNGLSLWKSNLDKKFDGIEECCICYSVLSGSNFQLPKISCRACKKKLHSACLYKWFSTSNKSSCPNCRNQF